MHPSFFLYFSIMYLRLTPNLLHFLPDLDALYALRPTFMKSTPGHIIQIYFWPVHKFSIHPSIHPSVRPSVRPSIHPKGFVKLHLSSWISEKFFFELGSSVANEREGFQSMQGVTNVTHQAVVHVPI
jgi:hypothetical protein